MPEEEEKSLVEWTLERIRDRSDSNGIGKAYLREIDLMNWPDDFINKIICGDCLEVMKEMPAKSIDMVICSPPYWGLRDYGFEQIFGGDKDCEHEWETETFKQHAGRGDCGIYSQKESIPDKILERNVCQKCQAWKGQLGLEPTPELYIKHLTEIFNGVKRVLKKEGTLWLNIGDTYGGASGGYYPHENELGASKANIKFKSINMPKCLCMIPERLSWSLIQNGWILRNKIIWFKPNSMPSSVTDRFSNRWEYLFMFSKSQKYYFDLDAVREQVNYPDRIYNPDTSKHKTSKLDNRCTGGLHDGRTEYNNPLGKNPGDVFEVGAETRMMGAIIGSGGGVKVPGGKGWTGHPKGGGAACQKDPRWCPPKGKNPGDFFEINTQPFPEAHFAVFPEKLCEKPIKAGCPEEVCKKCGKARERIVELGEIVQTFGSDKGKTAKSDHYGDDTGNRKRIFAKKMIARQYETTGWSSCDCNAGFEGGIVLDPFCGAGTALLVAKEMRRRYIGIDIKQEYCDMCEKRLAQGVL